MEERRPTPEDFLHLIARQNRGKLKVYLGAAAGVGKTCAMLDEGNRLRAQGIDVVIGYVEPHDRPETAARIGALEVVPPRVAGRGGEMDLDAVLRRQPTVALVDELAHHNAPGGTYAKRYDEVAALLDAGVNVITTVNIQHLESLYNIVEQATGVKVRERIPDAALAEADQIVHIDLPGEDLIERLKAGNIYPPAEAERALRHFFTEENLTRLREITFSEVANFLDRHQRRRLVPGDGSLAKPKPSALARVLVAVSSHGPHPETLLRKTARIAAQLNAEWYVVYVRTPKEAPNRIDSLTHRRLGDTLELAQKMGGTVVALKHADIAAALAGFARERGITHAIMGRPGPRALWKRFRPSLVERIAAAMPGVDLILG